MKEKLSIWSSFVIKDIPGAFLWKRNPKDVYIVWLLGNKNFLQFFNKGITLLEVFLESIQEELLFMRPSLIYTSYEVVSIDELVFKIRCPPRSSIETRWKSFLPLNKRILRNFWKMTFNKVFYGGISSMGLSMEGTSYEGKLLFRIFSWKTHLISSKKPSMNKKLLLLSFF